MADALLLGMEDGKQLWHKLLGSARGKWWKTICFY